MEKTVFFHIGSIKTGSTGIQKFCYLNRDALLAHDIDYIQLTPPQLHLPRWANADMFMSPNFDAELVSKAIDESPASRIIISEEGLMARPKVWQNPVFENVNRVVVLYLRNSVELVASWASENTLPYNFKQVEHASGRGTVTVDRGLGIWSHAYRNMLMNLYAAFETDPTLKVIIRPFPPSRGTGDSLISGFLQILGLEPSVASDLEGAFEKEIVNQGQSRRFCDASCMLADLTVEYGVEHIYSHNMVAKIERQLESGDERKVISTLSKPEMRFVQSRLITPTEGLIADYGAPIGLGELPAAFHDDEKPYKPINPNEIRSLFLRYIIDTFVKKPEAV